MELDMEVKIITDDAKTFHYQITKADGTTIILPSNAKMYASQIVAEAYTTPATGTDNR